MCLLCVFHRVLPSFHGCFLLCECNFRSLYPARKDSFSPICASQLSNWVSSLTCGTSVTAQLEILLPSPAKNRKVVSVAEPAGDSVYPHAVTRHSLGEQEFSESEAVLWSMLANITCQC